MTNIFFPTGSTNCKTEPRVYREPQLVYICSIWKRDVAYMRGILLLQGSPGAQQEAIYQVYICG
jgi:hypothetical protein